MFTKNTLVATPATMQAVAQTVPAMSTPNQHGAFDISEGKVIELWPMPKSTKVSIKNANETASRDVTAYIFNEGVLKNTKLDNVYGNGAVDADKPVITYNDGFGGKLINQILAGLNGGRGLMCKELTIIGKDATQAQSDEAILSLDAAVQSYNAVRGTVAPINLDLGTAIRNNAFKNGMIHVKTAFWVNSLTQFSLSVPKGYEYELNFTWDV